MLGLKGYSYLWLLIIIIIGSFFLAGGQFMFEDLNKLGIETTPTLAPGQGVIITSTPTPTPIATNNWALSVTNNGCSTTDPSIALMTLVIESPENGYLLAEILINNVPQYVWSEAVTIHPRETRLNSEFSEADGFSTNPWRLSLYKGGTQNPTTGAWSGGTLQITPFNGARTNCT